MIGLQKAPWSDWETIQLIGRGSFGSVYEIERKLFDETEKAAMKVISIPQNDTDIDELIGDAYDEESITETFKSHLKSIVSEYALMRKMNGSANIVNCDDVRYVQHDDGIGWDIFIKMELLIPLIKALPERIDDNTVIKIAKDMCHALELCKKHGIVHRDIKPQNIFVSEHGDYKLGDFGIAKTVEKTMGGTKIGTTRYMSPEVYHYQPYGHTADIYSLGLVLYWLLNERRMPFMPLPPEKLKAGADKESADRRLSGEVLPEPVHGSRELKRIVMKACAYDPKDRYQTASEMLKDLLDANNQGDKSDMTDPGIETEAWKKAEFEEAVKTEDKQKASEDKPQKHIGNKRVKQILNKVWLIIVGGIILATIGIFTLIPRINNAKETEEPLAFDYDSAYSDHLCDYYGCENDAICRIKWKTDSYHENYYCSAHSDIAAKKYRRIKDEMPETSE